VLLVMLGHGCVLDVRVGVVRIRGAMNTSSRASGVMDGGPMLLVSGTLVNRRIICVLMLALSWL
jgi:hypothetical protein